MSHFLKNVSEWFGYSRRERRASFILLLIICLVVVFRFIVPYKKSSLTTIPPVVLYREEPLKRSVVAEKISTRLSSFDPNSASFTELTMLGMNEKQASTIIRYREKGGHFRIARDLNRIYGMDSLLVLKLAPFVKIDKQQKDNRKVIRPDTLKKHYPTKNLLKKTDLNRCDSSELEKLPWIGPVLSVRIIKYRDLLGGYWSVEQLAEVYGLTDSTLGQITPRLEVDSSYLRKICINKATYNDLIRHPYLERYEVQSILKFRAMNGKIDSITQLVENRILSPAKAAKLKPYFSF
jgi:DNA uptake protein ComE-like DNA-binding protein